MTFRKRISGVLTLLGATVVSASLGCGGNGSSSVTVPPTEMEINLYVGFQQALCTNFIFPT